MTSFKVGDTVRVWDTPWQPEGETLGVVSWVDDNNYEIDITVDGEEYAVYSTNLDLVES